jgi:hypothetical protein
MSNYDHPATCRCWVCRQEQAHEYYDGICVDHAVCHFCGRDNMPIHPDANDQYGEPVCCWCFDTSYQPDP